jgi:phospholipase/carboxylesterase
MLHHLVSWPRTQGDAPHPALVLLHGRGSNEQDLFGLVPVLPQRPVVISVRAPFSFPYGGFYWYDLGSGGETDRPSLDSSLQQLHELIAALPEQYQVDPSQVYLLGFSQGALMSGHFTLANPQLVAGTVMLSGYLREPDQHGDPTGKPFFMAHGANDGVLPIVLARQARLQLEGLGVDLEYHEYPMEHQVIKPELDDLAKWFERRGLA